jgi:IS30 family transposase
MDNRKSFGDWEGDLLQFRTQSGHLLTLCERQARLTLAAPLPGKTAEATAATLCGSFAALLEAAWRSITFDTGPEFTRHQKLHQDLAMQTFFRDPH